MLPDHETIPGVSIVMPLYNKGGDVVRAVSSVLAQSRIDFELIIVNDGSTDNGPDLVKTIQDPRIRIIDQENKGVSAARNRGVNEACGELVAFLDADDEWYPDFLDTIFLLIKRFPECSVFATSYIYCEQDGKVQHPVINGLPAQPWRGVFEDYFWIASQSDPPLCSSAVVVRKNALISVGCFPVGITSGEDLLTWARLAANHHSIAYDSVSRAIFVQRVKRHEMPTRIPQSPDKVGFGLKELLGVVSPGARCSLRKYIAWWHKNRASMYLRLGKRCLLLQEVVKMGLYHLNTKFFIYLLFAFVPFTLSAKVLAKRNNLTRSVLGKVHK